MKTLNKQSLAIVISVGILVVGAAAMVYSGRLFQGRVTEGAIDYCDIYPGGVSDVPSWVPTILTTFDPPSQGATEVVSQVPCPKAENELSKQPFVNPQDVVSEQILEQSQGIMEQTQQDAAEIESTAASAIEQPGTREGATAIEKQKDDQTSLEASDLEAGTNNLETETRTNLDTSSSR